MADSAKFQAALEAERATTLAQRDQLRADLDEVIAAQADVATDDEHDPEGATIAYERSRLQSLVDQADSHLSEITLALGRLRGGNYGSCEVCGNPIDPERLAARPTVQTCIACAQRAHR
ncbi:MAG TPA: TraR/DksA C4-type zinc finger protein [Mycobacteriales bacterium]|nr:TraR/DksA C4-type zinc finger protein [Mycobacteriales bacterium]